MASLADYLKKYASNEETSKPAKKKKIKAKKSKNGIPVKALSDGIKVIDDDAKWQKEVDEESEEDEDAVPAVEETIDAKRVQRLERIRESKPYLQIGDDGSGWVSIDSDAKPAVEEKTDISPPRRVRHDSPDISPPRRAIQASGDLSPPRRGANNRSQDASPPQNKRHDSPDLSPPRKGAQDQQRGSPDLSPPRKRSQAAQDVQRGSPDLSPPRKRQNSVPEGREGPSRKEVRMSDGTLAGLRSGKEISEEMERKRKADIERFKSLSAEASGRGAQTVYRDKQGKKSNLEAIMEQGRLDREAKKRKDLPPPVWQKGLSQAKAAMEEAKALQEAASQPFARYEEDASRDQQLKEAVRWGDPMAHLVQARQKEAALADFSANPLFEASGFKVPQEVPQHSWMKRGVSAAPNRFGIQPGRHWDGVDRSTGFEKEYFKVKNERKDREREAYLWSVSDM